MDMIKSFSIVTIVFVVCSIKASAVLLEEAQEAMRCVKRLLPCHPYIHSATPPPSWCCKPMKEIAEKNTTTCLCAVFNHPEMLRLIKLTKENALNLLRSCGANHDVSVCSKTDDVSRSTASPGSTSSGSSSSSASTTNKAAVTISLLGFSLVSAYIMSI